MLEAFPLTTVTSLVAVTLVTTFFATSSDSGSLAVDHLTSGGKHHVPRIQQAALGEPEVIDDEDGAESADENQAPSAGSPPSPEWHVRM